MLPRIAAAYGQPFADSSAIPSYCVAEAARKLVKVVLNGDGGDEVLAGYRRYVAAGLSGRLRWVGRGLWRGLYRVLPVPRSFRTGYAFAHRFVRGMGLAPADRYLAWAADGFTLDSLRALSRSPDWLAGVLPAGRLVNETVADPFGCTLRNDFETILPDDLLVKMDIATMAHGLEARSPLLDHELIDAVSRFPESLKLGGLRTKPLLRKLAVRYLPEAISTAPKRGFEVPRLRWLRKDLRAMRDDVILSRSGLLGDLFDRDGLERLVRGTAGLDPARWATQVWTLLMLGLWDGHFRTYAGRAV
jgi:asparagine synthase (glutamine-hydrolysing)